MNKIIKYFDLVSQYRSDGSRAISESGQKNLKWWPQYIALLLGIFFEPSFQHYMETGIWQLTKFVPWLIASIIIGVMIFPAVYKSSFDATKPVFVQLCVIFTAGMGWHTILSTTMKAVNGGTP
jgi:hypothetical protein